MSAFDSPTLQFYDREAPVYTASGPSGVSRHLPDFLARLPAHARILELGCGGGIDAAYMIQQGHTVDATDGSAAIAAQAEARLGRAVTIMRFDQLDASSIYDAVVASASLLHVPRAALGGILQHIHRALKPGGWHLATYKAGGEEGRDRFGRYFNYPDAALLDAWYRGSGDWGILEISQGWGGGYDGRQGPWLQVTAKRAD